MSEKESPNYEIVKTWEASNASNTLLMSIPKPIREKLKLESGSRLVVRIEEGKIVMEPLKI